MDGKRLELSSAIDALRGIAAVLMIVNHIGVKLLDEPLRYSGASGLAVFCGSAAPVLFFFLTGFGSGLRAPGASRQRGLALDKVVALVIADWFLVRQGGMHWGLDFFGFIALSTLAVNLIAQRRHAVAWCWGLMAMLLLLRFGIAPRVSAWTGNVPLVAWLLGFPSVAGISYPLSPWLVYPLGGFVLARTLAARHSGSHALAASFATVLAWALGVAAVFGAAGTAAWASGMVTHRWGSVSLAFFVLSLAMLSFALATAMCLQRGAPFASNLLSLRGVAAFLVVPIHYAAIELLRRAGVVSLGAAAFGAACIGAVAVSIAGSKLAGTGLERFAGSRTPQIIAVAACAAAVAGVWLSVDTDGWQRFGWATAGLVAVALWLATATPSRRRE